MRFFNIKFLTSNIFYNLNKKNYKILENKVLQLKLVVSNISDKYLFIYILNALNVIHYRDLGIDSKKRIMYFILYGKDSGGKEFSKTVHLNEGITYRNNNKISNIILKKINKQSKYKIEFIEIYVK